MKFKAVLDEELAVIKTVERREAEERRKRWLKAKREEEARKPTIHQPADPRKLQAQIEVGNSGCRVTYFGDVRP